MFTDKYFMYVMKSALRDSLDDDTFKLPHWRWKIYLQIKQGGLHRGALIRSVEGDS